jgi:hypothetical protein
MDLEGSGPQFSILGPAIEMTLQVNSSNCFHSKRIEIDEKKYNDPIWIIPPHLGRLLVPKIFIELGEELFPLPSP